MRFTQKIGIYTRVKNRQTAGAISRATGRGKKHGDIKGPFYLRLPWKASASGNQPKSSTLAEVLQEADTMRHGLNAAERGLTVTEFDEISNVAPRHDSQRAETSCS